MEITNEAQKQTKSWGEKALINLEERLRKQILFWRLLVGFLMTTDFVSLTLYVLRVDYIDLRKTLIQIAVGVLLLALYGITYWIHHWDEMYNLKKEFEDSKQQSLIGLISGIFNFGIKDMLGKVDDVDKQIEIFEKLPRIINYISESELNKNLAAYQQSILELINISQLLEKSQSFIVNTLDEVGILKKKPIVQGTVDNIPLTPTPVDRTTPDELTELIKKQTGDPKMVNALEVIENLSDDIADTTTENEHQPS